MNIPFFRIVSFDFVVLMLSASLCCEFVVSTRCFAGYLAREHAKQTIDIMNKAINQRARKYSELSGLQLLNEDFRKHTIKQVNTNPTRRTTNPEEKSGRFHQIIPSPCLAFAGVGPANGGQGPSICSVNSLQRDSRNLIS
jgi:hypothetical protein